MTVRELIEALRHQDQDALVCTLAGSCRLSSASRSRNSSGWSEEVRRRLGFGRSNPTLIGDIEAALAELDRREATIKDVTQNGDGQVYEEIRKCVRGNVSTRRPPGDYAAVVLET